MSETRVRWAVRWAGYWMARVDERWVTGNKTHRHLFATRMSAMKIAVEQLSPNAAARLVKVTFKKKQRKSLGQVASDEWNLRCRQSPLDLRGAPTLAAALWEYSAEAVQAELERRGWRKP